MSTGQPSVAPLAVPPLEAARLLSLGMTKIYRLMRTGELVSYRDCRARRITTESIHAHMARRLADDNDPSSRHRRAGAFILRGCFTACKSRAVRV
jgi:excisionase family DNA binding protein